MYVDRLPPKSQIFEYWKERLGKLGFFVDWGEPGCWACGFHYGDKYDIRKSNESWTKTLARWNKIPLQRCHIIPRSLGGVDRVSNLFLMCRECHDLAPNTASRKTFLNWARSQQFWHRELGKMYAALDSFGIEKASWDDLSDLISSKKFRGWAATRIGLHRPQSGYAPESSRITYSSLIGLALDYQHRGLNLAHANASTGPSSLSGTRDPHRRLSQGKWAGCH